MRSQKQTWLRGYRYIDAFASTGKHLDSDAQEYVDGSPFVALRCDPPFDDCIFIELSQARLSALEARVRSQFPERSVSFLPGDANDILRQRVVPKMSKSSGWRGLIFLDPYGLEVDFETIKLIAKAGTLDVFINFSVMGVIRNLERERVPDERTTELLTRVMGDSVWATELYAIQGGLFGEDRASRPTLQATRVANLYLERVKKLLPNVSRPVLMRNSRGAPLYVLFLASHKPVALKITNDIFRTYETLRVQDRPNP